MSHQGFTAIQIGQMSTTNLKDAIKEIGTGSINTAMEWAIEKGNVSLPALHLKEGYNVTFEDPTKGMGVAFKRFQCFEGDVFYIQGMRQTTKNVIFRMSPGENVQRNMARHRVGAGLQAEWKTAEFTLNLLRDDRMTAQEFLEDTLYRHRSWVERVLKTDKMYEGIEAGTW